MNTLAFLLAFGFSTLIKAQKTTTASPVIPTDDIKWYNCKRTIGNNKSLNVYEQEEKFTFPKLMQDGVIDLEKSFKGKVLLVVNTATY